jgi:hypothetical protein
VQYLGDPAWKLLREPTARGRTTTSVGVLPAVLTMAGAHRAWALRYCPWLLQGAGYDD